MGSANGFGAYLAQRGVAVDLDHFDTIVAYTEELKGWAESALLHHGFDAYGGGAPPAPAGSPYGAFPEAADVQQAEAASRERALAEARRLVEHLGGLAQATRAMRDRYRGVEEMNDASFDGVRGILETSTGVAYQPGWSDAHRRRFWQGG